MAPVLAAARGALRPVPRDSEHLTLVFLGERDHGAEELLRALAPLAAGAGFRIRLGSAEVFPRRGRPRLVCAPVAEGADELQALAARARGCLEPLLPDLAAYREKPPHVTLARFDRGAGGRDRRAVTDLLATAGVAAWTAWDRVDGVELVASQLSPRGPAYTTVGEIALAPALATGRRQED